MSIKSTEYISRKRAIEILKAEIDELSNHSLASLLDALADTCESKMLSEYNNFIVSIHEKEPE